MAAPSKPVKFTARVRRGLALVRLLVDQSFDQNKPPSETEYNRWAASQKIDYQLALDWMRQQEVKPTPAGGGA